MPNGRCRMHGGNSPGAPRGKRHPNFKHGQRSKDSMEDRRQVRTELKAFRALMRSQL